MKKTKKQIVTQLYEDNPHMTPKDISNATGIKHNTVRSYMNSVRCGWKIDPPLDMIELTINIPGEYLE